MIGFAASCGMLILILDGKTALKGASAGVELCVNALIPSLFPFFVLSILLTSSLAGQRTPLMGPIAILCKVPEGAESLIAIGLMGGYPVGAQNISLAYRNGQLRRTEAVRMLAFCNNAGPAFIFGVLGSVFTQRNTCLMLWLIHMISALLVGILLPGIRPDYKVSQNPVHIKITDALFQSVKVMSLTCGWVILMRMVLAFVENWFLRLLPSSANVILSGILELSNGCLQLKTLQNEGLRFISASALLALGGICVTLQTISVTEELSLALYFPGKLMQCCFSIILSYAYHLTFPESLRVKSCIVFISAGIIIIAYITLKYHEKNSSIPAIIGV